MINNRSTLPTAPDLCKSVPLLVIRVFGTNSHHIPSLRSQMCVCVYIYTHTHTYIHTYIYVCVYIYIYTYTHTYIHTHTHIYIYTHTHIFFKPGDSGRKIEMKTIGKVLNAAYQEYIWRAILSMSATFSSNLAWVLKRLLPSYFPQKTLYDLSSLSHTYRIKITYLLTHLLTHLLTYLLTYSMEQSPS